MKHEWIKQEEKDILWSFNDWDYHVFACIMKDGSVRRFMGMLDENYNGEISRNLECPYDDEYNIDDIVYWCEITDLV